MQEATFVFECGAWVKDVVTGYTGIIMGRSDYLTGCNRYAVCPTGLMKDGKRPDWEWIDENRLVPMKKKRFSLVRPVKKEKSGFDGTDPGERRHL